MGEVGDATPVKYSLGPTGISDGAPTPEPPALAFVGLCAVGTLARRTRRA